MSKLEYLLSVAYFLGTKDKENIEFDLDMMDVEDLLTLCSAIVDEFYTQNEFAYLAEFLNRFSYDYIDELCDRLFR
jgi:hypothetical protein